MGTGLDPSWLNLRADVATKCDIDMLHCLLMVLEKLGEEYGVPKTQIQP